MPSIYLSLSQPGHSVTCPYPGNRYNIRERLIWLCPFCLELGKHLSNLLLFDCHLFCNYIKCALGPVLLWKVSVCEWHFQSIPQSSDLLRQYIIQVRSFNHVFLTRWYHPERRKSESLFCCVIKVCQEARCSWNTKHVCLQVFWHPYTFFHNHVSELNRPPYLVAKVLVSLTTKLFKDYIKNVFFIPWAVLML